MLEYILFAAALAGTAAGGWIDLKTTEVPDSVPIAMAVAGILIHIAEAYTAGSLFPLYSAVAVALGYLAFGYVLYYSGQWGEADVLLLGAVGFLLPAAPKFFNATLGALPVAYPIIFLLNTFIIGGIYSIAYALVVAARSKGVRKEFYADIPKNAKAFARIMFLLLAGAAVIAAYFSWYVAKIPLSVFAVQTLIIIPASAALFIIYRFAIVVDRIAFRKRVASSELKEGDVLAENVSAEGLDLSGRLFIGLTHEQIKKIQEVKRSVWIKEGIRYGPTFFLALIATWLYGNLILLIVR